LDKEKKILKIFFNITNKLQLFKKEIKKKFAAISGGI